MKNPRGPHRENAEDELRQYVLDRPELLLKMLDIAETRREVAAGSASAAAEASTPHGIAACG